MLESMAGSTQRLQSHDVGGCFETGTNGIERSFADAVESGLQVARK